MLFFKQVFFFLHVLAVTAHVLCLGGDAYHCLVELLPWWPSLKSSRSLEIVGLFSKMQSYAHEAVVGKSLVYRSKKTRSLFKENRVFFRKG